MNLRAPEKLFSAAVRNGKLDDVVDIFNTGQLDLNYEHNEPLRAAARLGHVEIVQWLLDQGAPIDGSKPKLQTFTKITPPEEDYYTPLKLAIYEGHKTVVELLLTKGASVTATLSLAVSKGHIDIIKLLVNKPIASNNDDCNIFGIVYKKLQDLKKSSAHEHKQQNKIEELLEKNYMDIISFVVSKKLKTSLIDRCFLTALLGDISCWLKLHNIPLSQTLIQGFKGKLNGKFSLDNLGPLTTLIFILNIFTEYLKERDDVHRYKFNEFFFETECYLETIPEEFILATGDVPMIEFTYEEMTKYLERLKGIEKQYENLVTAVLQPEIAGIVKGYMGLSASFFHKPPVKNGTQATLSGKKNCVIF